MSDVVTHLLHDEDDTHEFNKLGCHWFRATWFPFQASVTKTFEPGEKNIPSEKPWRWELRLVGAYQAFASGEADDPADGFRKVADAQLEALVKLRNQFP